MGDSAQMVAWAPGRDQGAATRLATAAKDGQVQIWQPRGLPLRKGGVGDPAQPQKMKPQFYTYLKADAAHPSGESTKPCALAWLGEGIVAACYDVGDVVAWRVAGAAAP
eukprot:7183265-Prymnesium_polylepis.1